MGVEYSLQTIKHLENLFENQKILRPLHLPRYEQDTELEYGIKGVFPPREGRVKLKIDRFVGGGYAGQVYRVAGLATRFPYCVVRQGSGQRRRSAA